MAANKLKGVKVTTGMARLSFPHLFEKNQYDEDSTPQYSCVLLFNKKKVDMSKLEKAANDAAAEAWGKDKKKWPKTKGLPPAMPFNDGDDKEDLEGYAGHTWLRASTQNRPTIVDMEKNPIAAEDENLKAGDYVRAVLVAKAYGGPGTKFKPGVTFYLQGLQKIKDGEPFGGGGLNLENEFNDDEDLEPDADDEGDEGEEW